MVTVPTHKVSVVRSLFTWWHDNVRQRGRVGTARFFLQEMRDFICDFSPARRRQRYGDMDFDWEYRVNTTEATVGFRNRLLGVFHSAYQPTQPDAFREMIGGLGMDYSRFTFIDLGSGKGRTLLMASDYPFARVLGVELLPELNAIATDNICKYKGGVADRVYSICADARHFEFPNEPTVLFLFHPFSQLVLESVIANLVQSLKKYPRVAYIVYHNPVLESVLANQATMQVLRRSEQYSIFVAGV